MTERKVLNRYYPPDYDPSKIPRLPKGHKGTKKAKIFEIRIMAPFNMRCNSCGHYIYKATKFNSRTEEAGTGYMGLYVRRFYIRCPNCVSEISFKTDPGAVDYAMEQGATRCFESKRLAEKQEKAEAEAEEKELEINPMKALEKRTASSQREMENLQALEELREMQRRHAGLDHATLLDQHHGAERNKQIREWEEDEAEVKSVFGDDNFIVKRLADDDDEAPKPTESASTSAEFVAPPAKKSKILSSLANTLIVRKSASKPVVVVKKEPLTPERPFDSDEVKREPAQQVSASSTTVKNEAAVAKTEPSSGPNALFALGQYSSSSDSE